MIPSVGHGTPSANITCSKKNRCPVPCANCNGDYIYWRDGQWVVGSEEVSIACEAGETNQGDFAVAVGYQAGTTGQGDNAVAVGNEAGKESQGECSVAVGYQAGQNNQGNFAVAVGCQAGQNNQVDYAVAIGESAAQNNQGRFAVAIGNLAAQNNQGRSAVAIGDLAGQSDQSGNAIAIGYSAGTLSQKANAVAIGYEAGYQNQGLNSIAIGNQAGTNSQHDKTIVINATGLPLDSTDTSGCYIKPIRQKDNLCSLLYDPTSGEITYVNTRSFAYGIGDNEQDLVFGDNNVNITTSAFINNNFSNISGTTIQYNGIPSKYFLVTFSTSVASDPNDGLPIQVAAFLLRNGVQPSPQLIGSCASSVVINQVYRYALTFTGIVLLTQGQQIGVRVTSISTGGSTNSGRLIIPTLTLTEV